VVLTSSAKYKLVVVGEHVCIVGDVADVLSLVPAAFLVPVSGGEERVERAALANAE
jgi:hypothetical protein